MTTRLGLVAVALSPAHEAWFPPTSPLDGAERARAARFLRPDDRKSFVAAHALKRLALAAGTGIDPSALVFRRDDFGKPHLAREPGIKFNLSHTRGMVALAWWCSGSVGVDVEACDRMPIDRALAQRVLTPNEWERFERSADPQRTFLRLWTAKEAVMKAEGKGLSLPFGDIDLSERAADTPSSHWGLSRYAPSARHLLAMAWKEPTCAAVDADTIPCHVMAEGELWLWAAGGAPPPYVQLVFPDHAPL